MKYIKCHIQITNSVNIIFKRSRFYFADSILQQILFHVKARADQYIFFFLSKISKFTRIRADAPTPC